MPKGNDQGAVVVKVALTAKSAPSTCFLCEAELLTAWPGEAFPAEGRGLDKVASGTEKLRHLCSVSRFLSFPLLQLWDTVHGQLSFEHTCPRPLNCIAFHPEGQVIAAGSWAGTFGFFHVDGLKAIKVRWVLCSRAVESSRGREQQTWSDGHPHSVSLWAYVESRS